MAQTVRGTPEQREFVKMVDSLTGAYNRWQVWQDMIHMFAAAIANSIPDAPHREAREKMYMDAIQHYTLEQQQVFPKLFRMLVDIMDAAVARGCFEDFLGDMFMQLELGNDSGGQFFTPYSLCQMVAEVQCGDWLTEEIERNGYISCNDPACGAGALLVAFAEALHKRGINYQRTVLFVGQDISAVTAMMCYIQLSLLGCAGYVTIGDTLRAPTTGIALFGDGSENTWYTPMWYTDVWDGRRTAETLRAMMRLPEENNGAGEQTLVETNNWQITFGF